MIHRSLIWKMVKRELTRHRSFNSFFVVNLALGLIGLVMINSLQDSINLYLKDNLRNNLGGDIVITSSQPINQEERKIIAMNRPDFIEESRKIDFFSMLNFNQGARLVNVIAIDKQFPLYGDLTLMNGKKLSSAFIDPAIQTEQKEKTTYLWMLPNTRQSLGLSLGDHVSIADKSYLVGEDISPDSSANGLAFSLAPKIYVQINQLDKQYLNTRGSRISYAHLFRLKQRDHTPIVAQQIADNFYQKFAEKTAPRVRTYLSGNRQISNLLTQVSSYFSMFALIALFLSGIGATYLYRGSITQRYNQMAIMHSLGIKKREIYTIYTLQSFLLGFFATVIALLFTFILLPFLNQFLSTINVANLSLQLTHKSILLAFLTGTLGSLAFCYPALQQISKVNSQSLLKFGSEIENAELNQRNWKKLLPYVSVLTFVLLVSVYQTSLTAGTFFLLIFAGGLCVIGVVALLLVKMCHVLSHCKNVYLKIALRNIVRHRWGSMTTFSVLGLGAFLLNIVPQIYQGLQHEIDASNQFKVPSLFLFDIQPEQRKPLQTLVAKEQQKLLSITPMVRGRLQKIDGKAPKQRRFEQQTLSRDDTQRRENRHLFRSVNITYRAHTLEVERIYQGKPLDAKYEGLGDEDNPIQLSIEERFAKRLTIKLGSLLEFSIQGIPVYGQVTNIRKVKWNSFHPNFFIVMQPGLLEEAPQTYLATIAQTDVQKRVRLQNEIMTNFSNISSIDVTDLVKQVLDISGKITMAVTTIALFAILVGFMVIYSISHSEAKQKSNEMNLLKVLGGTKRSIYSIFVLEFGFISLSASILGVMMSIIATIVFSTYLFENLWEINIDLIVLSLCVLNLFTVSLTLISARHILNQKAQLQNTSGYSS